MSTPLDLARSIIDASRYLTLATADGDGRPWTSPVFFAHDRPGQFLWVSRPTSEHSRNIEVRPEVSLAIFDSHQPVGTGRGVYVTARAARTEDGIEAFSAAVVRWGGEPWGRAQVTAPAELRLYRATATEAWVMDSENDPRGDVRTPIVL